MISARSRLFIASAITILTASTVVAEPVPTPPVTPKPSGPMPVPYPDPEPPPTPECPASLCPKARATLQLAGGGSTIQIDGFSWGASANGGGVAFFAHVGGFVFGFIVARLLLGAGRVAPQDGRAPLRRLPA